MSEKTNKSLVCKVCKIIDNYTLVLNVGHLNNVEKNFKFLIYEIGEEIFDPDTNQSLGKLEIVKGTGKVINVQERMCTIESNDYEYIKSSYHSAIEPFLSTKVSNEKEMIAFKNPQVGDFAKYIP